LTDAKIDTSKPVRIEEFRRYLGEAVSYVQYGHERIVVERYGRNAAVLISMEDYELLCRAKAAAPEAEAEGAVPAAAV
jgi:prevent-host-death family protein